MARFFHELLVAGTVLAPTELARMRDFRPLDVGWAKGYIQYVSQLSALYTSIVEALFVLKYCIATRRSLCCCCWNARLRFLVKLFFRYYKVGCTKT